MFFMLVPLTIHYRYLRPTPALFLLLHSQGTLTKSISQSPPVLSAPDCTKKEKGGVHKESAVGILGKLPNNKPNLLLPRIKAFSAPAILQKRKERNGGESYMILGSDIIAAGGISGRQN
jgi:hypothetical protein